MEVFELVRDEKVTIWARDYVRVEAETLEEAIEKTKNYEEDYVDCEYLHESLESLRDSGEKDTVFEIQDSRGNILYSE